ncbi:MAG: cysteine-rich CWC family protein [Pyrinomonadaceae bacterium]
MNLRILGQSVSPQESCEASTCESCGEPFACGAQLSGCWCMEVEVSEAVRAELRERFQRCLCRACLERFAENDAGDAATGKIRPGGAI